MPTITWLGSSVDSPAQIEHFGVTFPLNVAVEVDDKDILHKCWNIQFYRVEGWEPRGNTEEQPIRPDTVMTPRRGRVDQRKAEQPAPDHLPENERVSIAVTDEGRIEEMEDLPSIISGAQKLGDEAMPEPVTIAEPAAIPDEPEDVQELASPPRRQRRPRGKRS